ncbi:MAG: response regulator [Candidatus Omnitrophica bacterium]|jgi:DNA-binding response OmpR family regulator|nr:response regulator [Candidatus Omnitrophota bacterium]
MDVSKIKILAIDDEEDFTFFLKHNLERIKYQIITASGGEEGIELAKKEKPDLILLDLMMPKIDGFEVSRRLKEDPKTSSIPILMLTAKDDEEACKKSLSLKNEDYLIKPMQVEDLRAKIEETLKRTGKLPAK